MIVRTARPVTAGRRRASRACCQIFGVLLAAIANSVVVADQPRAPAAASMPTVVVTGRRYHDPVADGEATARVQAALHDDPFVFDGHISIVTIDGIVYLDGFVFDDWDLSRALRIARKNANGRRIVNRLEIASGGAD